MDEHEHCMNCLISRGEMIKLKLADEGKESADKEHSVLLSWFKETYELKRKPSPHETLTK